MAEVVRPPESSRADLVLTCSPITRMLPGNIGDRRCLNTVVGSRSGLRKRPILSPVRSLFTMTTETTQQKPILVGVIGGSGLYKLDNMTHV